MNKFVLLLGAVAMLWACGDESDSSMATDGDASLTGEESGWNKVCESDDDCDAPVGLCSKQPGATEGYCSVPCGTTADCPYGDWSCNVIGGCEMPAATWCGPRQETEDFAPIVTACEG